MSELFLPRRAQALGFNVSPFPPAALISRPMLSQLTSGFALLVAATVATHNWASDLSPPIEFNRDIRPILAEKCLYCHGQDSNHRQADLRLDQLDAAIEAGAIVPGAPESSGIISRVTTSDESLLMPPPDSNRQLSAEEKQKLVDWVKAGAPYEDHWAFVPPQRPAEPTVSQQHWPRNAIDRFVLQGLETRNWIPAPEATRYELIKRLYADLVGVPPRPDEIASFVDDPDPQAYELLVERLLQDQRYGERLALPWLDAARFADSNGFQQDGDTWQWYWRDWVVKALNEDLPFDQFTIWQLAGDLLPEPTTDQLVASGFNRNHLLNGEGGAIPEEQRFNILFDRIDTTATNWLGLTMACAQCHDHKYDPITMRDYYSLLDAFNRVPENGVPQYFSSRIRVAPPVIELLTEENRLRIAALEGDIASTNQQAAPLLDAAFEGWRLGITKEPTALEKEGIPADLIILLQRAATELSDEEKSKLQTGLRAHFDKNIRAKLVAHLAPVAKLDELNRTLASYRNDQIPRPMVMSDGQPRDTHILSRGEYLQPTEKVTFDIPQFLPPLPEDAPRNRLGFAQWLISAEHPLTARVQVNRMWQHFFGSGIVATAEDFGVQSEYPLHKDLLDWLAVEFRDSGWSQKHMHRLIVTSATYRQSSRVTPERLSSDPANRYWGRGARTRMPAMVLRDWALAAADLLDSRVAGKPVYPYQPEGVWEALAITKERDFTYPISSGADLYRRSLYTFWRRTVGPANIFDASNRQTCRVRSSLTSTPLHALTTLNDPTWVEAARMLSQRSMAQSDSLEEQLEYAAMRVLCRPLRTEELSLLTKAFNKQLTLYQQSPDLADGLLSVGQSQRDAQLPREHHAALTMVCLGILNLDEALTRE